MNTLLQLFKGESETPVEERIERRDLPRSVVTHDSIDDLILANSLEDSPRFREMTTGRAPVVPPLIEPLPEIDFTSATREEIDEWQTKARGNKQREEQESHEWDAWPELTADVFRSYHTHDRPEIVEDVDVGVELHKRVMPKIMTSDEHRESRNITRDDQTMSEIATMGTVKALRDVFGEELLPYLREQEELEKARKEAEETQEEIDDIIPEGHPGTPSGEGEGQPGGTTAVAGEGAGEGNQEGGRSPVKLSQKAQEKLAELESQRKAALERARELAEKPKPMDMPAVEALQQAAQAGQDAADAAKNLPKFGAGLGAGEPVYTSPEQALSIAERWANNPMLRQMAELFGRLDKDIRFRRSKRVVGGNDEIVDIEFGDNLARVLPSELALLADADTEDDFMSRYCSQELLQFSTVGEENAGRGPVLVVLDGSGSMSMGGGGRNIWARATAMCLLHIARLEKRDFGCVEFASADQVKEWLMPAKKPLDGEAVVDMASHLFNGGTSPIIGVERAAKIMKEAAPFKKADIVLVGDGDAGFGPEDERLRDQLRELGVRLFGIGVGHEMNGKNTYLHKYCEHVVDVRDMELTDPSAATAELATHIT